MPPKSTKPMKMSLLSSIQGDEEDAIKTPVVAVAVAVAGATEVTLPLLDKISRDCSSEQLKYLESLSLLEQKVCFIAMDHLESSFDLERSSGFVSWKKGQQA
jgi:hypothetical protein